ncbi:hypothetical protein WDZ92_14040 [Nostoc sp. NIES-2111]
MELTDAFRCAQQISQSLREEFPHHAFSGALAQQHWTGSGPLDELEILIPCDFGEEAHVARHLLPAAESDARRFRQILAQHPSGLRLRYILSGLPFEETMIARAVTVHDVPLLSAEDWLLLLLFRFRPGVESQVRSLLAARRGRLQWPYIDHWLPQLADLKEDSRPCELLQFIRATSSSQPTGDNDLR